MWRFSVEGLFPTETRRYRRLVQTSYAGHPRSMFLRILLVGPSVVFVAVNLLKFELGVDAPYDALAPLIDPSSQLANLLVAAVVILGPIAAVFLTLRHAATGSVRTTKPGVEAQFTMRARWSDVLMIGVAIAPLIVIGLHLIAEGGP
jgi:hypothetical protein